MMGILAAAVIASTTPFHIASVTSASAGVFDERTITTLASGERRFELMAIFAKGSPFNGRVVHMSTEPEIIDCGKQRARSEPARYETLDGTLVVADNQSQGWEAITPGSPLGRIADFICKGVAEGPVAKGFATLRDVEKVYFDYLGKPDELGAK